MMPHKEAAQWKLQNMRGNRDIFVVHETLQMSALQMLTYGIPSMEILMSDLYVNIQLTKPKHLIIFSAAFPSNYLLQGRGDSFGGQNFTQQQLKPSRVAGEFVSTCG